MTGAANKNGTYQVGAKAATPTAPVQQRITPSVGLLSPADQLALAKWNSTYAGDLGAMATGIAGKYASTQNAISAANLSTSNSKNLATQAAGARGVFNSSIQTNNMADLDASLAMRINTLNTNYNTYVASQQTRATELTGLNTATQNYYTGLETQAAQALDTNPPANPPQPPAIHPASTPAGQQAVANQAAQHPTSVGAALTTPSQHPQTGAALTTPSQPKPPKLPSSTTSTGQAAGWNSNKGRI